MCSPTTMRLVDAVRGRLLLAEVGIVMHYEIVLPVVGGEGVVRTRGAPVNVLERLVALCALDDHATPPSGVIISLAPTSARRCAPAPGRQQRLAGGPQGSCARRRSSVVPDP